MRPDGSSRPTLAGPDAGPAAPLFPIRLNGEVVKGFGRGSKEVFTSIFLFLFLFLFLLVLVLVLGLGLGLGILFFWSEMYSMYVLDLLDLLFGGNGVLCFWV